MQGDRVFELRRSNTVLKITVQRWTFLIARARRTTIVEGTDHKTLFPTVAARRECVVPRKRHAHFSYGRIEGQVQIFDECTGDHGLQHSASRSTARHRRSSKCGGPMRNHMVPQPPRVSYRIWTCKGQSKKPSMVSYAAYHDGQRHQCGNSRCQGWDRHRLAGSQGCRDPAKAAYRCPDHVDTYPHGDTGSRGIFCAVLPDCYVARGLWTGDNFAKRWQDDSLGPCGSLIA